jgi:hypothetical protein
MMKVYDPRDPSQDFKDPKTWKLTDNPALLIAHYGIDGLIDDPNDRTWDSVITAANWCDHEIVFKC